MPENEMNNTVAETPVANMVPKTSFEQRMATNHPVSTDIVTGVATALTVTVVTMLITSGVNRFQSWREARKERKEAKRAAKAKPVKTVEAEIVEDEEE